MAHTALKPLTGLMIALLIVGFSPLVDADAGWKHTLGTVVWWAIIATGVVLLVVGAIAFATRRRGGTVST
jgi:hypothetical protein